jgi:hypothetical protein
MTPRLAILALGLMNLRIDPPDAIVEFYVDGACGMLQMRPDGGVTLCRERGAYDLLTIDQISVAGMDENELRAAVELHPRRLWWEHRTKADASCRLHQRLWRLGYTSC